MINKWYLHCYFMRSNVKPMQLDFSAILFLGLTALTAVVWTHSWICDRRERNEPKEFSPEFQAEEMLAVE